MWERGREEELRPPHLQCVQQRVHVVRHIAAQEEHVVGEVPAAREPVEPVGVAVFVDVDVRHDEHSAWGGRGATDGLPALARPLRG